MACSCCLSTLLGLDRSATADRAQGREAERQKLRPNGEKSSMHTMHNARRQATHQPCVEAGASLEKNSVIKTQGTEQAGRKQGLINGLEIGPLSFAAAGQPNKTNQ